MFFSGYVFTKGFWIGWVVVCFIWDAIDIVARHISKVGRSGRQASECSRMTGSKRALLWEVCFDSRITTPGTKSHAFLRALNRIKKYLRVAAAIAQPVPA